MSEIKFLRPKTISEYVNEFKEKVIEEMAHQKTKKLEIDIDEVKKFFKYQPKEESKWLWLSKSIRDELVKQGVHVKKRRGFSTAYITID